MSVKIRVLDSGNRPVTRAEVFVKWANGYSKRTTDSSGVADLGCSAGTAEYVRVNGKDVMGRIWLKNGETTVYK